MCAPEAGATTDAILETTGVSAATWDTIDMAESSLRAVELLRQVTKL